MAITLPESIKSTATAGERILFRTLKEYLPEEYIVHYEPNINGFRPDFVIIGHQKYNKRAKRQYLGHFKFFW